MKSLKKLTGVLLGAAFIGMLFGSQAQATLTSTITIHVSITGNKSVTITGATTYEFGALAVGISTVSQSSITVTNNSTVFVETYTVQGTNAISTTAGVDWALQAAPGANDYALAAQFSDNQPTNADGNWANDDLDLSANLCSATDYGNGTEGEAGSNVPLSGDRGLWFRMKTPTSVSDATQHDITVYVSVY